MDLFLIPTTWLQLWNIILVRVDKMQEKNGNVHSNLILVQYIHA